MSLRDSLIPISSPAPVALAARQPLPEMNRRPRGVGGTSILGGDIQVEEWNSALVREKGYGSFNAAGIYDKMRKSDHDVHMALWTRKLPLLAADAVFIPVDDSPIELEIADLCAWQFFSKLLWYQHLYQSTTSRDFGFSLFEAVWDVDEVPADRFPLLASARVDGNKKLVSCITDLAPRLQRTVHRWVARDDCPSQVKELVQFVGSTDMHNSGERTIQGEHLLRYTHRQEGSNFEGISTLRPAYKSYKIKSLLEELDAIRHDRMNVGHYKLMLPDSYTDADETKAAEIGKGIASHENGYVILPPGFEGEWETSGSGQGTQVGESISRHRRGIADSLNVGHMSLGEGDVGSYALAETMADSFLLNVEVDARETEQVFNQGLDGWSPVQRLVQYNYGERTAYPQLKFKNIYRLKDLPASGDNGPQEPATTEQDRSNADE